MGSSDSAKPYCNGPELEVPVCSPGMLRYPLGSNLTYPRYLRLSDIAPERYQGLELR